MSEGEEGFQGHVAGPLDGPFVVLFEEEGATYGSLARGPRLLHHFRGRNPCGAR